MSIVTSISSFFGDQRNLIRDFYHLDYWNNHTLMEGFAEAAEGATWFVHEKTKESHRLVQASAGAGLGVAKLLGSLPIGLLDWGMQVVDEVPKGPGQTIYKFLEVPVKGFYHGGVYVFETAKQWSAGSLTTKDSYAIADEITGTLGMAALLLFGVKKGVDGGNKFLLGLKTATADLAVAQVLGGMATATATAGVTLAGGSDLLAAIVMMSTGEVKGSTKEAGGLRGTQSGDEHSPAHVGEKIARLRNEKGLTQQQLADEISGLSRAYLGLIEIGRNSGQKYFRSLEKFFRLPEGYLNEIHRITRPKRIRGAVGLAHTQRFRGNEVSRQIGEEIKNLRTNQGLTQEALGKKIGTSRSMVQEIEHGLCWGTKYYARLERFLKTRKGHFYSLRKTLESKMRPSVGTTTRAISSNIVGAQFLSALEGQIGKPLVSVTETVVSGKFVATAGDGSVYEVTVGIKEVYKP